MTGKERLKAAAGTVAAELLEDGMIVGLGTGSTAKFAVDAIGKRVAEGLRIVGIATSEHTAEQARSLGIPLATLAEHASIDITIDGADEVELGTLNLIKGGGGALLREKIVASSTVRLIIIVDESKLVERLGRFPVPVEVAPFGWQAAERRLCAMQAGPKLRLKGDGEVFTTDGGHYILDCAFGSIADAPALERRLNDTVGVMEHGLFLGMTARVIVGAEGGVRVIERQ